MHLSVWLSFVIFAFSVVGFAFFAIQAAHVRVPTNIFRGRLTLSLGVVLLAVGLYLIASHGRGISLAGIAVLALGTVLYVRGWIWDDEARKKMEASQRLLKAIEHARARTEQNGEESTNP